MRTFAATLICCASLSFAGAGAVAASHTEKGASAPMAADGMMKKEMSMQECKDYMAMAKKDDAMMKKDAACEEMMKKDEMMKKEGASMKKEEPMKK